jgi:uncharacterized hydrophobic protein (TIGR00271 family)
MMEKDPKDSQPVNNGNMAPIERRPSLGEASQEWWKAARDWFRDLTNLEEGADREGTIIAIKSSKRMRGANAWLLVCSIMIASLGLDLNSGAVIIGAMLISPLMAPILGVGLSVAINDREALGISLQHFTLAIVIALVTSTAYFAISPLGDITDEIQQRTSPNLLDGLVAIFGGLAGIISTSRREKSSAIPGVAIATALMPPLCVTGYGLANQNWDIAINSFYLFFLNSFFIATTSFIIIRFLKFEMHSFEDKREAMRTRLVLILFSILLIAPSIYILFNVIQNRQREYRIETFVEENFNQNPSVRKCIDYTFLPGDSTNQLVLEMFGRDIPSDSLSYYAQVLEDSGVKNTRLSIIQESDLDLDKVRSMDSKLKDLNAVVSQLETSEQEKKMQTLLIEGLARKVDSLQYGQVPFEQIGNEAKSLYPDLERIGFGNIQQTNFAEDTRTYPAWLIKWKSGKRSYEITRDEGRLKDYLKVRTKLDTVILIRY